MLIHLFLTSVLCNICMGFSNNVCGKFENYANMTNENCWYNPDMYSSPEQITNRYGYQFKYHQIITADGYNLTLFRVNDKIIDNKQPILLHHGIASSGMCFITTGNKSLAFYLARNSYDVWIANARGSPYSSGHETLKSSSKKYWDFSFHEIAIQDLPAIIDYIKKKTSKKIIYVGHSMGSTISYIYATLKKEHAQRNLKGIISITQIASLKFIKTPLRNFLPLSHEIIKTLPLLGIYVLFQPTKSQHDLIQQVCVKSPTIEICRIVLFLLEGENPEELSAEDFPIMLTYQPARTSVKTIAHYLQMSQKGRFQMYDYGPKANLKYYNSDIPPIYKISDITVPVHLFYGNKDNFAGEEDVYLIYGELNSTNRKSVNRIPKNGGINYNHMDFLYGKRVVILFYKSLMARLDDI